MIWLLGLAAALSFTRVWRSTTAPQVSPASHAVAPVTPVEPDRLLH
ncbi:hypothetical protein ACI2L1_21650 [Streptomyces sp. NPDC019531]